MTPLQDAQASSNPYAANTVAYDIREAERMQAQAWQHTAPLLARAIRVWSWQCTG